MEARLIKREELLTNDGQIEGLPRNPRFIRDEKFEKLQNSIKEDPEFMQVRPLVVYPCGDKYLIIGGNMRFRACRWDELPCVVLSPDTPIEKLKRFVIKDNAAFGQWDFDMLANEWDAGELADWGVDVLTYDGDVAEQQLNDNKEIDTTDFDEKVKLVFSLTIEDHSKVRSLLRGYDDDINTALLMALNIE